MHSRFSANGEFDEEAASDAAEMRITPKCFRYSVIDHVDGKAVAEFSAKAGLYHADWPRLFDMRRRLRGAQAPADHCVYAHYNAYTMAQALCDARESLRKEREAAEPMPKPHTFGTNFAVADVVSKYPEEGSLWRHRNGATYEVLMVVNMVNRVDYPTTVVYRNVHSGQRYSRPLTRWFQSMTPLNSGADE